MTPQILLRNLEHCFMRMRQVALLIFDECHHAQTQNRHPYGLIMKVYCLTYIDLIWYGIIIKLTWHCI